MKRHLAYLKYVLRHKWFVFLACRVHQVPLWRAILHDWHKFLPSEWAPYARCFYKPDGSKQYLQSNEFAVAWLKHQHRGKHHWQHWIMRWDNGSTDALPMPDVYIREMVSDWWGAGRAITGNWGARQWYEANCGKMLLHSATRLQVEALLLEQSKSHLFSNGNGQSKAPRGN